MGLAFPGSAMAVDFVVTNNFGTTDSKDANYTGSLHAAIELANNSPGDAPITFEANLANTDDSNGLGGGGRGVGGSTQNE